MSAQPEPAAEVERDLALLSDAVRLVVCVYWDEGLGDLGDLEEARPELTGASDWHAGDLYERHLLQSYGDPSGEYHASLTRLGEQVIKEGMAAAIRLAQPGMINPDPWGMPLDFGLGLDEHRVVEARPAKYGITICGIRRDLTPIHAIGVVAAGPNKGEMVVVPVIDLEGHCSVCGRRLNRGAAAHAPDLDCGGDCNACMAEAEGRPL